MRITRTTAVLALAVAAVTTGTAHASIVGGVIGTVTTLSGTGSGGSSGIQDWFATNLYGASHQTTPYCEYALEPDGSGHFEAGATASDDGTLSGSRTVTRLDVTCTFYGTPNGAPSFPLAASAPLGAPSASLNGSAGRPTKICMTVHATWSDGDAVSVTDLCRARRIWVTRDEVASVGVGLDSGTDAILDGATGTALGCTSPAGGCASRAQSFAGETASTAGGGYRPGVEVSVETPPRGR
jgi:hypothetical protein